MSEPDRPGDGDSIANTEAFRAFVDHGEPGDQSARGGVDPPVAPDRSRSWLLVGGLAVVVIVVVVVLALV